MTSDLRNPVFDNIKFLMIFLVVLGHALEPFVGISTSFRTLYTFIYTFHMPVFVIVAGMFSSAKLDQYRLGKLLKSLIIPFIIFSALYETTHFLFFKQVSPYLTHAMPYWLLWFLPSLFFWRITLRFAVKLPLFIVFSIGAAVVLGAVSESHKFFGLARTLYFWPFFILGYKFKSNLLALPNMRKPVKYMCGLGIIFGLFIVGIKSELDPRLLYGSLPYHMFDQGFMEGASYRLVIYLFSFCMSICVISLCPQKLPVQKNSTKNTLFAYLWHGFFIKALIASGLIATLSAWPILLLFLLIVLISTLLTFGLSSKVVANFTNKCVLGPFNTLLKEPPRDTESLH